jgi:hypothetical protein
MNTEILEYHNRQTPSDQKICGRLAELIEETLLNSEAKYGTAIPSGSWTATPL